ncbi:MAG: spore germination protein, partial [Lachnospiraceae bacterium]
MPVNITSVLKENVEQFETLFSDCADIKKRKIKVGQKLEKECYIAYIEVTISSTDWKDSAIGKLLGTLRGLPEEELVSYVKENIQDISDSNPFGTI